MAGVLSITSSSPILYTDIVNPGPPESSYLPDTVNDGQLFVDASNQDLWYCWNSASQTNLEWVKIVGASGVAQVNSDWNAVSGSAQILNKPSIPTILARSFSQPTFSQATTATQLSGTRDAQITYAFPASITSIIGTQTITATLKYADDSGMSTNVVTVMSDELSAGGILNLSVANMLQLNGIIPAGKYAQVTFTTSGGAVAPSTLSASQLVLL